MLSQIALTLWQSLFLEIIAANISACNEKLWRFLTLIHQSHPI